MSGHNRSGARGLPTYSFTTDKPGLEALARASPGSGVNSTGPVQKSPLRLPTSRFFSPIRRAIIMQFTRRKMPRPDNPATGLMTGVGYIELEAPNIEASIGFYQKVLGFELQSREPEWQTGNSENGQRSDLDLDRSAVRAPRDWS